MGMYFFFHIFVYVYVSDVHIEKGVVVMCAGYGHSPKQTKPGEKRVCDCLRIMT